MGFPIDMKNESHPVFFATYFNLYFVGQDVRILKAQNAKKQETGKRF